MSSSTPASAITTVRGTNVAQLLRQFLGQLKGFVRLINNKRHNFAKVNEVTHKLVAEMTEIYDLFHEFRRTRLTQRAKPRETGGLHNELWRVVEQCQKLLDEALQVVAAKYAYVEHELQPERPKWFWKRILAHMGFV